MLEVRREWLSLAESPHIGPSESGRDDNTIKDSCAEIGSSMKRLDIHESGQVTSRESPGMWQFDPSQYYSCPTRGPGRWNAAGHGAAYNSSPFAN